MACADPDNIDLKIMSADEPGKETYNPAYNVYAQDINLEDEARARTRELEEQMVDHEEFEKSLVAAMHGESSQRSKFPRQISSAFSSSQSDENDTQRIEEDAAKIDSEESGKRKHHTLTEEEKKMLQKLRKVVELCTQEDPMKRPTSSEVLEMLQL
ncbi:uncharacterized protein [Ptychodera flava]|uniref:uncharacterized protein n=1 Tax=Ptychodera flava TaxID=63121 RepID=UPI00396A70CC